MAAVCKVFNNVIHVYFHIHYYINTNIKISVDNYFNDVRF